MQRTNKASGRARFYLDHNVEASIAELLRYRGFHVEVASELGFEKKSDRSHLQAAKRRGAVLVTRDKDYLDDRVFPFHDLKDAAIVVLRTEASAGLAPFGYMLLSLVEEIGRTSNGTLFGMKIELAGSVVVLRARVAGRIETERYDISQPYVVGTSLFGGRDPI
jgi:predicted nuclease of predicted toxin-antitoxin system